MQQKELLEKVRSGHPPVILDVRSGFEFRAGHIPGAVHASLARILCGRGALPGAKDDRIVLTCEHGPRAWLVKRVLQSKGYSRLELLDGHMAGWRRSGLPQVRLGGH